MTAALRQQMPQVRQTRAFAELDSSPSLAEVAERLAKGESFNSVAAWLKSKGEFGDKQPGTLAKMLARWWAVVGEQAIAFVQAKQANQIAEIERLEKLAAVQEERIQLQVENEKKIGTLFPTLTKEISEARAILHLLLTMKQGLGLYKSVPLPLAAGASPSTQPGTTVNVQVNLGTKLMQVIEGGESRRRVLDTLRALAAPETESPEAFNRRFNVGDRTKLVQSSAGE